MHDIYNDALLLLLLCMCLETSSSRKREEREGRDCLEKIAAEMQASFQPASRV